MKKFQMFNWGGGVLLKSEEYCKILLDKCRLYDDQIYVKSLERTTDSSKDIQISQMPNASHIPFSLLSDLKISEKSQPAPYFRFDQLGILQALP